MTPTTRSPSTPPMHGTPSMGQLSSEEGDNIATDGNGNLYVTGRSDGTWNGPAGQAPLHAHSGDVDIFVLKLDSGGTYQWHTFYGSSIPDVGTAIVTNGSGSVYVTGDSVATWNGPAGQSPLHAFSGSSFDIFVLKLDSNGAYQWHTFYGSNLHDQASGIATDRSGNVYVTGDSYSTWNGPVGENSLHAYSGLDDIFVLKLDSNGAYQWHTFHGSSSSDHSVGVAADGGGNLYVAGRSDATWDAPTEQAPLHPHSGDVDIFVLKLDDGGAYQWHTFYGSSIRDVPIAIATNESRNVYVTGGSVATWNGPAGQSPLHPHSGGSDWDIFALKLDSNGAYQWHTFFGSSGIADYGLGIAIDGSGNVYAKGSSDAAWNGPAGETPLNAHSGNHDIVVFKIDSSGAYQWHTFYGSTSSKGGVGIVTDGSANLYVTGSGSQTWDGPAGQSPLHAHSGGDDILVLKLSNVSRASGWKISTIDSIESIGPKSNSIAIDSNNKIHISYYDPLPGDLKYATNASGSWQTVTIDSSYNVGSDTSIAVDSNNKVHISYRDNYTPALKYATNASSSWETSTIDGADWGGGVTSIAVDSNNKVHISYCDSTPNYDLKYATNASGSWETFTIDAGDVAPGVSSRSIAIDSNNKVHINYFDITNLNLKYATNASGLWETFSIETSETGSISSIAVDSINKVHIGFYDDVNGDLKYTTNASGSWETFVIDSAGDVGGSLTIAVDSNNKVHISYLDETNFHLKYANNVSGLWETITVDSTGDVGWFNSIAVDSKNKVHISYYDRYNADLKYATNASPAIGVPYDFDGDGKTDIAVYRVSTGAWWIIPSSTGSAYGVGWGGDPSDIPVTGDYDGDRKSDIAFYRGNTGTWWIIPSSGVGPQGQVGAYGVGWGGSAFKPVPGDYDGDGKDRHCHLRYHRGCLVDHPVLRCCGLWSRLGRISFSTCDWRL